MSRERWRPVKDWPEYEVSDKGRLRRGGRVHVSKTRNAALCRNGDKPVYFELSRLILEAFVGPPPPGKPNALHENDVGTDHRLENLRWGSQSENVADAKRNGHWVDPPSMSGRKHSKETRKKMSESRKKYYAEFPN